MAINKGYLTAKTTKASDEYITPDYAITPILEFLNTPLTIWCPFDKEDSPYVRILRAAGHKVLFSHIDDDKNFFEYEPEEPYDIIISNPPFSLKDAILKRLYELNKPYMILLPIPSLQGQKRFPYIKDCQALIFDKRISFMNADGVTKTNPSFGCFYLCRNALYKDLIFRPLEI